MKLLRLLMFLHDCVTLAAAILAAAGLIGIVVFYVLEVFARYLFNASFFWVSDFVSYTLAISVFLALPKVTKDKGHVAVTILVDMLPRRIAGSLHVVIMLIGFASLTLASWISLQENIRQHTRHIGTLAIVSIPQWWISSFITFGLAFSALYMLRHAFQPQQAPAGGLVGSAG